MKHITSLSAVLATTLFVGSAGAAPIGALDGTSDSSTFGDAQISQVDPFGWVTEVGSATDANALSLNAAHNPFLVPLANNTEFVAVFDTGVAAEANFNYQLDFLAGHYSGAAAAGGTYIAEIGLLDGGVFTQLGSVEGDLTGQGFKLYDGIGFEDQVLASTDATPGAGTLAVRLTSSGDNYLGFDDIVLDGAEVPEPGSLALLGLGGLAMLRRRRN